MDARTDVTARKSEGELLITRVFDAPRELVYQAWTRPEHVARWYGPRGFTIPFADMDIRPGGAYRFCMRSPEGVDYWTQGSYRELVEPERIVFTWNDPPNETVVTVTLADQGGKTRLTLHQAVFASVEARDSHEEGWSSCLEDLADFLARGGVSS